MKKTKIVSTVGPATDSKKTLSKIIDAGVDVIRQNYSHVDHEQHGKIYDRIRNVSEKTAVMIDTKGPEMRLRQVKEDTVLEQGHEVCITTEEFEGDEETLSVNYPKFIQYIESGDEIRIDDGKIELKVDKVEDKAYCTVVFGGEVSSRKSVNVPGKDIGLSAPTDKDVRDIEFAAQKGYDFVSLSFIKKASDVKEVRDLLDKHDSDMQIISKIEHSRAIENFDEILEESDAIMVARGDLGVEMPAAELPQMQKNIIQKCNDAGKPVITATQMLESMTENSTATRAEISDVANAVIDGSDAVMLSGETAIGEYPVETVKFMSEVVRKAEASIDTPHHTVHNEAGSTREIISKNVWQASKESDADFILTYTSSGETARQISKYRPEIPVLAFTYSEKVERQLQLAWGVRPLYQEFGDDVETLLNSSRKRVESLEIASSDDKFVISAGLPDSKASMTNMMQIREFKELKNPGN